MTQTAQSPNRSSFPAVVAILGVFLIFYFVVDATYLNRSDQADEAATVERPSLEEHLGKEQEVLSNYEVVDAEGGKVRLPIDRAMELVIAENAE